jgi:hypothetical protein
VSYRANSSLQTGPVIIASGWVLQQLFETPRLAQFLQTNKWAPTDFTQYRSTRKMWLEAMFAAKKSR